MDVLEAMQLIDKCWKYCTKKTIANCFTTCGFGEVDKEDVEPRNINVVDTWVPVAIHLQNNVVTFEDFALGDDGVAVWHVIR